MVRSLSPETLARLADLAALAATVLTDLAGSRTTGEQPASEQAPDAPTDDAADGSGPPPASGPAATCDPRAEQPHPDQ